MAAEISHHRDHLWQLRQKLTEKEKLIKSSRDSQVSLNESVDHIRSKLSKLGEEYEKAAMERDNTETKLQRNERDCVLLSEMQKAHNEQKCQLLQEMIDDKRREIVRLRKDLDQKEQDLESVRQEAKALQEQLSEVQEELSAKHEEVKQLQQEKKELVNNYNTEKEQMQTKVTFLTADREDMMVCKLYRHLVHNVMQSTGFRNEGLLSLFVLNFALLATTDYHQSRVRAQVTTDQSLQLNY